MIVNNSIPRVLQVFTALNRGGSETMIMNYYRYIDRTKIQFDFLLHRKHIGAFEDEIEDLGGRVFRMPAINPFFPKTYYKNLSNFFRENNSYKIIHSHINTFNGYPLKVAKKNNIPCRIAHAHIALEPLKVRNFFNPEKRNEELKNTIKYTIKKSSYKYATHLMTCGEKAGNWLFDKNKFIVVNNAIKSSDFQYNEKLSLEKRVELGLNDSLVLGHVGRFYEQKNHVFLIDIFKSVLSKKSNAKLAVVGDGELRITIERKAKELGVFDSILFLGVRSDIPELLQMMDVFVFPSLYEGLPVTLIEAQAAGLKVFTSDTITREVALTNDIEFLSIKESPDYWANRILSSVPYERKDNYDLIKEKGYDIEENARKLQEFYLEQSYER